MDRHLRHGVPVIDVSHLPAASSFYAAITQPLGIVYLSSTPGHINFGSGSTIIFSLAQSATFPPRPSHITLLAQSPAAVASFYQLCLQANISQDRDHFLVKGNGEENARARARDLDGNMLEAVYEQRDVVGSPMASGKEGRRVLEWQEDVARSTASSSSPSTVRPPAPYRRTATAPTISTTERPSRILRRETITTETYRAPEAEGGMSALKMAGTLLGALGGAAIAYALVDAGRPTPTTQDQGPKTIRRVSYDTYNPAVERIPARSSRSYVQEPQYVEQYTIAAPSRENGSEAGTRKPLTILPKTESHASHRSRRSHHSDDRSSHHSKTHHSDERSHHSRHSDHSDHSKTQRAKSYVSSRSKQDGVQYISTTPVAHRSSVSARHVPLPQSTVVGPDREKITVISAHRVPLPQSTVVGPDREKRSVVSARHVPLPQSTVVNDRDRTGRSTVSARHIPLPESAVGGGRHYAASAVGSVAPSLAPSDSVSSVGGKRERERLRERMRERW